MEFWSKTAILLHRCAVITIVFFNTMSDFAKIIPQKELVYLLKGTIHTSSYYSAEVVCISTLVDVELLLELKIKQAHGISLVKLVLPHRKSGLQTERLSVLVILGEYCARLHSEPAWSRNRRADHCHHLK
jgi:hypothetical protein